MGYEHSPAWPHGELTRIFDDLFFVVGTNEVHHAGADLRTSRTMLVVRESGRLALINTVRLDEDGLSALEALGRVTDVIRLGAFHGRDDPFYRERYGAALWAPRGAAHADGRAPDRTLDEDTELPFAGARVLPFRSATQPEAAIWMARDEGILVTCDAVQSWREVDRFFSPETGALFREQGLIGAANIPATWLGACEPSRDDFERLLALPFRHLVSAHGEPLLDEAHARLDARVRDVFGSR